MKNSTFPGLSGEKLQSLSAGAHCITIQFTPTTSCTAADDFSVRKEYHFEIEPIGNTTWTIVWNDITMYIYVSLFFYFSAHASLVSVDRDTATIKLYSNAEGEFKCSLDEAPFQKCIYVYYKSALFIVLVRCCGTEKVFKIICWTP